MSDPAEEKRVNGSKRQPDRAEKLSAQLRANLKRRKQQIKSRKQGMQAMDDNAPSTKPSDPDQEA